MPQTNQHKLWFNKKPLFHQVMKERQNKPGPVNLRKEAGLVVNALQGRGPTHLQRHKVSSADLHPRLGCWHLLLEDLRMEVLPVLEYGQPRYNLIFPFLLAPRRLLVRAPCCTSPTHGQVQPWREKRAKLNSTLHRWENKAWKIHCCTQDHTGNLGQSSQLQMAIPEPVLRIPIYGIESTGC